jgi:3-deoxy-D-manno-octulosonic-acid transferase
MTPEIYRGLTTIASPLIGLYLRRRRAAGKEDPLRFGERLGRPGAPRPPGPLAWIHAASVGEAVAMLPLLGRILDHRADAHALVTTGTVTSARLMGERLPPRALHQYVPVDRIDGVRRFLTHWRPDLALWTESEFWPNLIGETHRLGVPCLLVNARMSDASFVRWRRLRSLIAPLLSGFALCLAQNEREADRLRELGAPNVRAVGNLKWAAPPLPADADELARLRAATGHRTVWLAASTHAGEEAAAAEAHRALEADRPGLLTVIVPRHPERGEAIARELRAIGLTVAMRSLAEPIASDTGIYLADTLGELGLFYRLADVVFVGGSLVAHGGHNPLEPARLDCALIHGPHMFNFAAITETIAGAEAATAVSDRGALTRAVGTLLDDGDLRRGRAAAARAVADAEAGVLDTVAAAIAPYLDALPRLEVAGAGA